MTKKFITFGSDKPDIAASNDFKIAKLTQPAPPVEFYSKIDKLTPPNVKNISYLPCEKTIPHEVIRGKAYPVVSRLCTNVCCMGPEKLQGNMAYCNCYSCAYIAVLLVKKQICNCSQNTVVYCLS